MGGWVKVRRFGLVGLESVGGRVGGWMWYGGRVVRSTTVNSKKMSGKKKSPLPVYTIDIVALDVAHTKLVRPEDVKAEVWFIDNQRNHGEVVTVSRSVDGVHGSTRHLVSGVEEDAYAVHDHPTDTTEIVVVQFFFGGVKLEPFNVRVPKDPATVCVDLYALEPMGPRPPESNQFDFRRRASATVSILPNGAENSDSLVAYYFVPDFCGASTLADPFRRFEVLWDSPVLEMPELKNGEVTFKTMRQHRQGFVDTHSSPLVRHQYETLEVEKWTPVVGKVSVTSTRKTKISEWKDPSIDLRNAARNNYLEWLGKFNEEWPNHIPPKAEWTDHRLAHLSRLPYFCDCRFTFHVPGAYVGKMLDDPRRFRASNEWWQRQLDLVAVRYGFDLDGLRPNDEASCRIVACAVKAWASAQRYWTDYAMIETDDPQDAFVASDFKTPLELADGDCEDDAHYCARAFNSLARQTSSGHPQVKVAAEIASLYVPLLCYGYAHNAGSEASAGECFGTHAFTLVVRKKDAAAMVGADVPANEVWVSPELPVMLMDTVRWIEPVLDPSKAEASAHTIRFADVEKELSAQLRGSAVFSYISWMIEEAPTTKCKMAPMMPKHDFVATLSTPFFARTWPKRFGGVYTFWPRRKKEGTYGVTMRDFLEGNVSLVGWTAMTPPQEDAFDAVMKYSRPTAERRVSPLKTMEKIAAVQRLFNVLLRTQPANPGEHFLLSVDLRCVLERYPNWHVPPKREEESEAAVRDLQKAWERAGLECVGFVDGPSNTVVFVFEVKN